VAMKTAALASAVIATLRAGSRVAYLSEHDAIGVMDGPVIQNTNETYPLFELSEAFRHCVRLSFAPGFYQNVQSRQPVKQTVEPYNLSPQPYRARRVVNDDKKEPEATEKVENATKIIERIEYNSPKKSFWRRQRDSIVETFASVPSALSQARDYVSMAPHMASYWMDTLWNWRREKVEDLVSEVVDGDWDWNWITEGELRFNATVLGKDGEPTTSKRVAELSTFAPNTFQHMRKMFGISEASFRKSIFGTGPFVSFQSNSKGAARVGGVFFFTRDGAFMIKTIKKEEAKTFLDMLPKYHKHMRRFSRTSLLTRFCGMYGVRIYDEDSIDHGKLHTFVVMNAAFPAEASRFISQRFDLKGSTVGREVSEEELTKKGSDAVLKDLDLAREVATVKSMKREKGGSMVGYGLSVGPLAKSELLAQLREDVKLLVDCQVMDYSLLVGVVDMESFLHIDESARKAIQSAQNAGRKFSTSKKAEERVLWALGAPIRLLAAPPAFIAKQTWSFAQRAIGTIVTEPLPYYGAGECGVSGGLLSTFHGTRNGKRALYYMSLIDFLQPWTTRKVIERQIKGLMGYDTSAISCVTPEEYAQRFLDFLDGHLS